MDTSWTKADFTKCTEKLKPRKNLFEQFHYSDMESKSVKVSEDEWCISCYALYIDVCKDISKMLPDDLELPLNNKNEFSVDHFNSTIGSILIYDRPGLDMLERVLKAIMDCVIARRYHHQSCYKRVQNFYVNRGVLNSDASHDSFLIVLCQGVGQLLKLYNALLEAHNTGTAIKKLPRRESILKQNKYESLLNVCQSMVTRNQESINAVTDELVATNTQLKSLRYNLKYKYEKDRTRKSRIKLSKKNKRLSKPKKKYTLPHPRED